jgi:hypothetical protein
MLDVIVFIKSEGVNVRLDNLRDTLVSFEKKNKNLNYKFYLVLEPTIAKALGQSAGDLLGKRAFNIVEPTGTWAEDFNLFLDKAEGLAEWLLITHDDVQFITDDYFASITREVSHLKDKIGWITSTSEHYYKNLNKMVTDTFRAGFYKDNNKWGAMFQLHYNDFNRIDYPSRPVKIHGPMSALMITPMSSMKKIGQCENWTPYTMLVDEDWSLEALKNNLYNAWVPTVHHLHPNRIQKRKAFNRWDEQAHTAFLKKWGFDVGNARTAKWEQGVSIGLEKLRKRWGHTFIPWSSYRNSYDWEFVDE